MLPATSSTCCSSSDACTCTWSKSMQSLYGFPLSCVTPPSLTHGAWSYHYHGAKTKKTSIEDVERGVSEHWSRDFRISSGGAADPMAL
jgi:hypothetical protein